MFGRMNISLAGSVLSLTIIFYLVSSFSGFSAEVCVPDAGLKTEDFQKGICYVTWAKDRFESKYSEQSLEMLKKMGVEFLQINVTQFQEKFNSKKIFPTDCTPSDKSVKYVIKKAHKLGLKIMLKPHLDILNSEEGYWRADIGFYDEPSWEEWFREYAGFILHYAKIAEKYDVEIFCVGTELSFTTQKTYFWEQVINEIRNTYKGKLTYAANWDNYSSVGFWHKLDYIGIDAYFPLTYKRDPSLEDIKDGWRKWVCEIDIWYAKVGKPIIFTEIGYSSSRNAPSEPWKDGYGNADVNMQAKCYTAFFDIVWKQPWLAGVYWWRWAPTIFGGGEHNRHFTPLKKPAAKLIESNYKIGRRKEVERKTAGKIDLETITRRAYDGQKSKLNGLNDIEPGAIAGGSMKGTILNTSTLQPVLKTQKDSKFQKDWKEKHMMEYVN